MTGARAAAVLFDMDGLLVDSEKLWTIAEMELAEQLGGTYTPDLKAAVVGLRLDIAIPAILRWFAAPDGPDEVEAATRFLSTRMVELFHQKLDLMPGALWLLDSVRDLSVPTGLVSSSYRELVDAAVQEIGADRFDVTVAGDEVAHGKPSPEPYLLACEILGVAPSRVIVLEDAPSGVRAGEAAGATVVAVPWATPVEERPNRPVVKSLEDIDPVWLVDRVLATDRTHDE